MFVIKFSRTTNSQKYYPYIAREKLHKELTTRRLASKFKRAKLCIEKRLCVAGILCMIRATS